MTSISIVFLSVFIYHASCTFLSFLPLDCGRNLRHFHVSNSCCYNSKKPATCHILDISYVVHLHSAMVNKSISRRKLTEWRRLQVNLPKLSACERALGVCLCSGSVHVYICMCVSLLLQSKCRPNIPVIFTSCEQSIISINILSLTLNQALFGKLHLAKCCNY